MKITCFECDALSESILREQLHGHDLRFFNRTIEAHDLEKISFSDVLVVFIYSRITHDILRRLPFLKLIVTLSTGYDHIDVSACHAQGVRVCNVPKYGGTAVAEHTFALLLALVRQLPKAVENTSHDDFSIDGLCGSELAGKTLGVIGGGTIGSAVIRMAHAFGMHVLVYERTPSQKAISGTTARHVPLNYLLRNSDMVSLHVPYTNETHHLINKKTIAQMKPGAYLINTARGGLVDAGALHLALATKRLAGAALDVLEGEIEHREAHAGTREQHLKQHDWSVIRQTHRLLKLPNVIVTPHIAFYTREALTTIAQTAAHNIQTFMRNAPENVVA